jgi:hypothetical protein
MKKLESSKTTGGLYWNKFWEFIAIRNRFKKEKKNILVVNDTTSRIEDKQFQHKIEQVNEKSVLEISTKGNDKGEISIIDSDREDNWLTQESIQPQNDFTSPRLDAIMAMHRKDYSPKPIEVPAPILGFVPRKMRKMTMRGLKKDVKSRPGFYKDPLEGFMHKLQQSARLSAEFEGIDWSTKLQSSFDKIWNNLLNDEGNLRFSCKPIELEDKRLLAWNLEWNGPGQSPMSETDDGTLIKAFPAIAVLLLDNTIELLDGRCEHFMEIEELTTVKTEDLLEVHPFILHAVNSNMPYSGKESIHVPISPVLDIMRVALNVDMLHNMIEVHGQ